MIRGYDSGRSHLLPFEATQHTKKGQTHMYICGCLILRGPQQYTSSFGFSCKTTKPSKAQKNHANKAALTFAEVFVQVHQGLQSVVRIGVSSVEGAPFWVALKQHTKKQNKGFGGTHTWAHNLGKPLRE